MKVYLEKNNQEKQEKKTLEEDWLESRRQGKVEEKWIKDKYESMGK